MRKTIGILGGMGPLATNDLFRKIIDVTEASCDQEHVPVLIDSNTNIPDRTSAILGGGEDPVPELVRSARRLEAAGADFLIMPCNTAHYFYEAVAGAVDVPVLHMVEVAADALAAKGVRATGLLATDGTIASGVYHRVLEERGIRPLTPEADGQREVMRLIYDGIKAGQAIDIRDFEEVLQRLFAQGAECFVLGCTELPVAFAQYALSWPTLDPTQELACAAVKQAGGTLRKAYR